MFIRFLLYRVIDIKKVFAISFCMSLTVRYGGEIEAGEKLVNEFAMFCLVSM